MGRILFYLTIFALLAFVSLATGLTPEWLHKPTGLYFLLACLFIVFDIGYELGLRAPTDIYSVRSLTRDSLYTRCRKLIVHLSSPGFSKRGHKLNDGRLGAKPPLNAQRNYVRKNLDDANRHP